MSDVYDTLDSGVRPWPEHQIRQAITPTPEAVARAARLYEECRHLDSEFENNGPCEACTALARGLEIVSTCSHTSREPHFGKDIGACGHCIAFALAERERAVMTERDIEWWRVVCLVDNEYFTKQHVEDAKRAVWAEAATAVEQQANRLYAVGTIKMGQWMYIVNEMRAAADRTGAST